MPFEGCTRRVLVFHRGGKDHCRRERDPKGVGHYLVVFFKRIFADIEMKTAVEVFEEDFTQMIAFGDDYCVFFAQIVEIGKRRAKHRVRRDVGEAASLIKFLQMRFDRGNIGNDAIRRQKRKDRTESIECMIERDAIDDKFGVEILYLINMLHAERIINKTHPFRILFKDRNFVVEA